MAEHRVDQVAGRRQPVPGPLPAPDELLVVRPRPRPAPGHPLLRGPRAWRRSLTRFARTKRGRWVLIALACLAVLLVGLIAQGFLSSPAPSLAAPGGTVQPGTGIAPSTPAPSKSAKNDPGTSKGGLVNDPVNYLRGAFPDNPLNHLRGAGLHHVTISARSSAPIAVVGYLVPTGLGSAYGEVKPHARHWTVSEQALGRGYLAAIFVQSGRSGAPITCSVSVDGHVTNTETTSGAYGRAVCLG